MTKNYSKGAYEKYVGQGMDNNYANQYLALANQPNNQDALASAFTKSGSGPAMGPQQQASNALLLGIGSGIQGAADDERAKKTQWLEEQTAGILKLDMQLKSQMQEQQMQQQQLSSFVKNALPAITQLSQANLAGDQQAADLLGRNILQAYKSQFNDPTVGDYTGQRHGTLYYVNPETGNEEGRNVGQFLFQTGLNLDELFGHDKNIIFAGLMAGGKAHHEKTELMDQYALQGAALKNQGMQADINYRNAQIGAMQMQNSPEYMQNQAIDEKQNMAWKTREKNNTEKLIPEIASQFTKNEEIIPSIDEFKNLISNTNLAGGSNAAALKRFVAQQTGTDEDVINAKNLGQFYLEWMGRVTKGAISDKDMEEYKSTFAGIDKNPKASIRILDRLQKTLEKQNLTFEKQLSIYEQDPGANLNSLDVLSSSRKRMNDNAIQEETPQDTLDKALRGEIPLEQPKQNKNIEKLRQDLGFQ